MPAPNEDQGIYKSLRKLSNTKGNGPDSRARELLKARRIGKAILFRILSALAYEPERLTRRGVIHGLLAFSLFFSSSVGVVKWYWWMDGKGVSIHVPILWSVVAVASLLFAPEKRLVLFWCLALYTGRSAIGGVLSQEPHALLLAGVFFAASMLLLRYFPPKYPFF
jgi:hypothetical protein